VLTVINKSNSFGISISNISISNAVSKEVAGDDVGLPNRMVNLIPCLI
jgi:hypothetical protein